jgi:putative flippase GtrA
VKPLLGKLIRFGSVGVAATLLYAALAAGFGLVRLGATPSSIAAYALAAVFAYLGHKRITFRSEGAHADEVPKFAAASALGLGVAALAPIVLTDRLHLPRAAPILATCVGVPVLNFLILDRLVFARRGGVRGRSPPSRPPGAAPVRPRRSA